MAGWDAIRKCECMGSVIRSIVPTHMLELEQKEQKLCAIINSIRALSRLTYRVIHAS